jgi:predicted GNAT superfamily acetyltransferase
MVAIRPDLQSQSLGQAIKLEQKNIALKQGYTTMKWTYDPLLTKNANLNLKKLGAKVLKYNINEYGEVQSELYGALPTDRFEVTWDLTKNVPVEFPTMAAQLVSDNGTPTVDDKLLRSGDSAMILQVPLDHGAMRKDNPKLALDWQLAVRKVSVALLDGGYCVAAFRLGSNGKYGEYLFLRT